MGRINGYDDIRMVISDIRESDIRSFLSRTEVCGDKSKF